MLRRRLALLAVALQTLRANPLHTLLSTLGLVIGVAALVAILMLGDGLERFAREQIELTTDLQVIRVTPRTVDTVDGVRVRRTEVPGLTAEVAQHLADALGDTALVALGQRTATEIAVQGDTARRAGYLQTTTASAWALLSADVATGRLFDAADVRARRPVAVASAALAARLADDADPATLIGQHLEVRDLPVEIVGILGDSPEGLPRLFAPLGLFDLPATGNTLVVKVRDVERVPAVQDRIEHWLDMSFEPGRRAFLVTTNEGRVAQARQGVLAFKLVMGFITGLSVLVGGIGVMNVLLVSVTERTREIGIRKAAGARRGDVVLQFLAESVTISTAGSLVGLVLGFATVSIALPIIRQVAEVPFRTAFSWSTLGVVVLVALGVGIGFGTYPAWRAARLAPVEAIRHE